jgi:hypothetical protein
VYRWEIDGPALPEFGSLGHEVKKLFVEFMDAVTIVDPTEYQPHYGEPRSGAALRILHFGYHNEGLATLLDYPPDELVLVVRIQWLGHS